MKKICEEKVNKIRELAAEKLTHKQIAETMKMSTKSISMICFKHKIKNGFFHGFNDHPIYSVHSSLVARCKNLLNKDYGGRGICVCEGFKDSETFCKWGVNNGWKEGLEVDRIENNLHYSCGQCEECLKKDWKLNCRFVTRKENANNKRSNHLITAFGETKNITQWSENDRCVVPTNTLKSRIGRGIDIETALTQPSRKHNLINIFGEAKTIKDWSKDPRCVVPKNILKGRLDNDWNPELALITPVKKIKIFNEEKTITEWSEDKRCMVSIHTLFSRINYGWDYELALITPTREIILLTIFGEEKSFIDWSKDKRCVVSNITLRSRLNTNWEPEKALTTPARKKNIKYVE